MEYCQLLVTEYSLLPTTNDTGSIHSLTSLENYAVDHVMAKQILLPTTIFKGAPPKVLSQIKF